MRLAEVLAWLRGLMPAPAQPATPPDLAAFEDARKRLNARSRAMSRKAGELARASSSFSKDADAFGELVMDMRGGKRSRKKCSKKTARPRK